jgi:hypothetical protein
MLPLEGWVSQALRTCGAGSPSMHANSRGTRGVPGTAGDSMIAGLAVELGELPA